MKKILIPFPFLLLTGSHHKATSAGYRFGEMVTHLDKRSGSEG